MSIQHAMLVEAIGGAETVKSCAAEGQVLGQWRRLVDTSARTQAVMRRTGAAARSEEHPSELQSLMRISYAVFCLKKNKRHVNLNNDLHIVYVISANPLPVNKQNAHT